MKKTDIPEALPRDAEPKTTSPWRKGALVPGGALTFALLLWSFAGGPEISPVLLHDLRAARLLAALLTGISLALAAGVLQQITQNHLADPGLLGINAGGVLGVVLGISFFQAESFESWLIWSGSGAFLAGSGVTFSSTFLRPESPGAGHRLVLVGVAISGILGGIANFILSEQEVSLDQYRFWNLGSLSGVRIEDTVLILPGMAASCLALLFLLKPLSALSLGNEVAGSLGVSVWLTKVSGLAVAAVLTSGAISLMGPVMFGGFLCATIGRTAARGDLTGSLLISALTGICLMLVCDTLARVLVKPYEIPVGTLISLAGAPLLIFVVNRKLP